MEFPRDNARFRANEEENTSLERLMKSLAVCVGFGVRCKFLAFFSLSILSSL